MTKKKKTKQKRSKQTLSLLGWNVVLDGDEYVYLERRGSKRYLTVPVAPMRSGPDEGTLRIHVSEGRRHKQRFALDAKTLALVPVRESGADAWPGALKLRMEDVEAFAETLREFANVLLPDVRVLTNEQVEEDYFLVHSFTEDGAHELRSTLEAMGDRIVLLPDVRDLEDLARKVIEGGSYDLFLPSEAVEMVARLHDISGSSTAMMLGYRVPLSFSVEELMFAELDDLETDRLVHHRYADGREVWQALPGNQLDRAAGRSFALDRLGPRFLTALRSILSALGVNAMDLDALDEAPTA